MATEGFYVKLYYFQLVILLVPVEELMNYMTNARLRLHVPLFSPEKLLIRVKKKSELVVASPSHNCGQQATTHDGLVT